MPTVLFFQCKTYQITCSSKQVLIERHDISIQTSGYKGLIQLHWIRWRRVFCSVDSCLRDNAFKFLKRVSWTTKSVCVVLQSRHHARLWATFFLQRLTSSKGIHGLIGSLHQLYNSNDKDREENSRRDRVTNWMQLTDKRRKEKHFVQHLQNDWSTSPVIG